MSVLNRQMVYAPDSLVRQARERGMRNLSGFVRAKLQEFIDEEDTGDVSAKTAPGSASQGGQR